MSNETLTAELNSPVTPIPVIDLDSALQLLSGHGEPFVTFTSSGWVCAVEIKPNITGTAIKVRSEYKHDTPTAAANQCLTRLRDALGKLGGMQ